MNRQIKFLAWVLVGGLFIGGCATTTRKRELTPEETKLFLEDGLQGMRSQLADVKKAEGGSPQPAGAVEYNPSDPEKMRAFTFELLVTALELNKSADEKIGAVILMSDNTAIDKMLKLVHACSEFIKIKGRWPAYNNEWIEFIKTLPNPPDLADYPGIQIVHHSSGALDISYQLASGPHKGRLALRLRENFKFDVSGMDSGAFFSE